AYPFGKLADTTDPARLLGLGLQPLIAAAVVLATASGWPALLAGVALWGLHMGMTQGLLAAMVAATAPEDLRGTAFGVFNLVAGLAMLAASAVAGALWQGIGAPATFAAGAAFAALTLAALPWLRR
ncbi:MAG: MFS transporter, partial [Piscinibacter sp.]|uniref:MFS transporter n=1 Tax=Piscinibacter sp. TaxID=1903157 RepID=UPI003D105190